MVKYVLTYHFEKARILKRFDLPDIYPSLCHHTYLYRVIKLVYSLSACTVRYLRFTNWQIDAIKSVDPQAVVTQGAWNERANTVICGGCRNYWSDECLVAAGEKPAGTLGFYQMHAYSWEGSYGDSSVMSVGHRTTHEEK
jgi:hypothetical protein